MKKLSPEIISEILSLYQSGQSPQTIAKQFDIYANSVSRIIKKSGIERNQLKKITDDYKDIIQDTYMIYHDMVIKSKELDDPKQYLKTVLFRVFLKNRVNKKINNIDDYVETEDFDPSFKKSYYI